MNYKKRIIRVLIVDDSIDNIKLFTNQVLTGLDQMENRDQLNNKNPIASFVRLEVSIAKDGDEAYHIIVENDNKNSAFDILFIDLMMGGGTADGDKLLNRLIDYSPLIPKTIDVFIVSQQPIEDEHSSPIIDRLRKANELWIDNGGNIDFIHSANTKEERSEFLNRLWSRIYNNVLRTNEIEIIKKSDQDLNIERRIIGQSPIIMEVRKDILNYANKDANTLIIGESGTGKEEVARCLHDYSKDRSNNKFVAINCSAIPENLFESEMFGYEKGAFTGAEKLTIGKFEKAHRGTLFLDEINSLSLSLQAKLLRAVQFKKIDRLGSRSDSIDVDVRVIAAAHNLESLKDINKFRRDLFYRLNVLNIQLPTLENRREDIPLLFDHFVNIAAKDQGCDRPEITQEVVNILRETTWDGNIRELENTAQRYVAGADISERFTDKHKPFGNTFNQRSHHIYFIEAIQNIDAISYVEARKKILQFISNKAYYLWHDSFDKARVAIEESFDRHVRNCTKCKECISIKWPEQLK